MVKTNRIRCLKLGLIWVCLLLAIYVYDLHFAEEVKQMSVLNVGALNELRQTKTHNFRMKDDVTFSAAAPPEGFHDVKLYDDALEISKDGQQNSKVYFSDFKNMSQKNVSNVSGINMSTRTSFVHAENKTTPSVSLPPAAQENQTITKTAPRTYRISGREHWTINELGRYNVSLFSPPPGETPKRRFPKAIIIGAGKCGTRALLEFLQMHPYVVAANSEVHFFDQDEHFQKGFTYYKSKMPLSYSNQVTIEKTPSYIWSERAIHEIYKLNRNMKLILIIKDPVVRVISQAIRSSPDNPESTFIQEHEGTLRVSNESRTVDWGIYVKYIKLWLQVFPKSQLHILESRDFVTNPTLEIQRLEYFLGIPRMITEKNFYFNKSKGFYCMRPFHLKTIVCLSSGKGMPHPKINPILENLLYKYYRPHNEALFQLLGKRYDWTPKTR
ncbi:heparan sulfate glucosamine 3-O-sulfotransferase 1 [Biomphalaria glabrata]|nr:heparan sulfate glucosamine 3-O-sulfotransferase 1-like [Biomphalaria glabrata]